MYSEDAHGRPVYHLNVLDDIFDAFKAAGVRPMVELGFMPKDLAAMLPDQPNQPYQVHFPQGDVLSGASNYPPADYAKWQALTRAVTEHLVDRYGKEEVLRWYSEVWNEPDIAYWHGSREDYFKLYDFAVAGVRQALPGATVGGPATTSPRSPKAHEFLQAFLEHASTGKSATDGGAVPLDFISFHVKGQPEIKAGRVTMGIQRELLDVDRGFTLVAGFPKLAHLPIILSEADPEGCAACSSKMNPANAYRNGTLYPAYTAAAYKRLFALADQHTVNLLGMVSWLFEFEGRDSFEGFRSLSTNGVDKPVLNVFRMFGLMSGTRVRAESAGEVPLTTMLSTGVRGAPDVDAMATLGDRKADVLLWNYHDTEAAAAPAPTTVTVAGLPKNVRRVLLQHFRIDETHSNAYTAWKTMGSPAHPTAEQTEKLRATQGLELLGSPDWLDVANGAVRSDTAMPRQAISLLELSW